MGSLGPVFRQQATLNFGTVPTKELVTTLADSAATLGALVHVQQSSQAAAGKSADENEMDRLAFSASVTSVGVVSIYVTALPGPVVGNFLVDYFFTGV